MPYSSNRRILASHARETSAILVYGTCFAVGEANWYSSVMVALQPLKLTGTSSILVGTTMNKIPFYFDTYCDQLAYNDKDVSIRIFQSDSSFAVTVCNEDLNLRSEWDDIYSALDAANKWYQNNILHH